MGDLTCADHIPSNKFDCIICTQTLQLIFDVESAIRSLHRMLKPHGVLLLTIPGISQIARPEMNRWGDYWRLTTRSAQQLSERFFPADHLHVESFGNVLSAIAFLHGLASEEIDQNELDYHDPDYQVTIVVRAAKPDCS